METQDSLAPPLPPELRDGVLQRLGRYGGHFGDRLGRALWDGELRDFAVMAADLLLADLAVWLVEDGSFFPVFNGPRSEPLQGRYAAGGSSTVLAQVYGLEQSFGGGLSPEGGRVFDAEMDRLLGIRTLSFLASPLHFGASLRGVVSALRFIDPADPAASPPPPFDQAETLRFESLATTIGRLFDERLFATAFDLR